MKPNYSFYSHLPVKSTQKNVFARTMDPILPPWCELTSPSIILFLYYLISECMNSSCGIFAETFLKFSF